jgi:protein TonB
MEVKKSKGANIDDSRASIIIVGILFVSSMILASFSYRAEVDLGNKNSGLARTQDGPIQEEEQNTPLPPPPETPPQIDVPQPPTDAPTPEIENTDKPPIVVVTPPPPPVIAGPAQVKIIKEIIDFPQVEAQFPGGNLELQKWIANNVNYPQTSIEMNEQGKVYVSFVVEEDGSVSGVVVEKGVSQDLDKEAKRLIRSMPKWTAGQNEGEKARTRCRIPINFSLQ